MELHTTISSLLRLLVLTYSNVSAFPERETIFFKARHVLLSGLTLRSSGENIRQTYHPEINQDMLGCLHKCQFGGSIIILSGPTNALIDRRISQSIPETTREVRRGQHSMVVVYSTAGTIVAPPYRSHVSFCCHNSNEYPLKSHTGTHDED